MGPSYFWKDLTPPDPPLFRTLDQLWSIEKPRLHANPPTQTERSVSPLTTWASIILPHWLEGEWDDKSRLTGNDKLYCTLYIHITIYNTVQHCDETTHNITAYTTHNSAIQLMVSSLMPDQRIQNVSQLSLTYWHISRMAMTCKDM